MITIPVFHTLEEAFLYCRDMDASLRERLDMFSAEARRLRPAMQDAVDRLVVRLTATDVGAAAPQRRLGRVALTREQYVAVADPRQLRCRHRRRGEVALPRSGLPQARRGRGPDRCSQEGTLIQKPREHSRSLLCV